jgi:hypothetical protein
MIPELKKITYGKNTDKIKYRNIPINRNIETVRQTHMIYSLNLEFEYRPKRSLVRLYLYLEQSSDYHDPFPPVINKRRHIIKL